MANVPHMVYEYSIYRHQAINSVEHREYELLNPITLAEQLSTARETINNAMKRLCKIVSMLQIRVQTAKNIVCHAECNTAVPCTEICWKTNRRIVSLLSDLWEMIMH
jgi:hypothetical protein